MGDGLDAATVAPDVKALAQNCSVFSRDLPVYVEDLSHLAADQSKPAAELVPDLATELVRRSESLIEDMSNTIDNLRGSAELRQAVANTRLQRTVVSFTLVALIVAVVSLLVTIL
ncbi:hypothetical protein [Blastococcus saxobsidens]|nr:hypothetical protein [Blastococcus saxobsidens]